MLLGQYGTRSNQGAQAVDAGVARDIARALVEVLDQDQDPGVRASAAYALSFLGASVVKTGVGPGEPAERDPLGPASLVAAFNQALERDPSSRLPLADAIERLGPVPLPAPEGLLAALEDPSINVRGKAIMALAHFTSGVDKAIPVLLADLHGNTERFPPDYVAAARQMQPSPAVVPVVLKALESDDGLLREAAEILLSRIDPLPPTAAPAVVASVRKALSVEEQGDGDRDSAEPAPPKKSGLAPRSSTRPAQPQPGSITSSLVMALAKVAPPEQSVPLLIEVSKRKAPAARAAAARALASVGPKAATAIPRLRELVNDPKAAVKDAAKLALETIDPQSHSTKKTEPSGKRP
jgi:HEAT repeat protein